MKTKKVLVVVFQRLGIPAQHYFVGIDEKRIVFFSKLKIDCVQSTNTNEVIHPMFVLSRQGKFLDIGSCEWMNDDGGSFLALHGLGEIRSQAKQYDIEAHDHHFLKADWFLGGDLIEIRKETWGKTSWLSQVATSRQLGARFHNVFPKETLQWNMLSQNNHHLNLLFENEKSIYKQLSQKIVIFENPQPILASLKAYY